MHTHPPLPPHLRRIVVIGATGAGKSHLAALLAQRLDIPHVEIDALYWLPGWHSVTTEELRARVEAATRGNGWVLDGNYSAVRDLAWGRAHVVLWLDYPLLLTLARLLRRIWHRWRSRELLWGTNTEPLWVHFKLWSKDSLVNWLLQSHGRHRRTYPAWFARKDFAHLQVWRFRHPRELQAWLAGIPAPPTAAG